MSKTIFVVVAMCCAVGPVRADQQSATPNVLFLCVDDMKNRSWTAEQFLTFKHCR